MAIHSKSMAQTVQGSMGILVMVEQMAQEPMANLAAQVPQLHLHEAYEHHKILLNSLTSQSYTMNPLVETLRRKISKSADKNRGGEAYLSWMLGTSTDIKSFKSLHIFSWSFSCNERSNNRVFKHASEFLIPVFWQKGGPKLMERGKDTNNPFSFPGFADWKSKFG